MARLVFGLMQSLDGYVSGPPGEAGLPMPDEALHAHFSAELTRFTGGLYGRRMYEIMRYWDADQPDQNASGEAFAAAWRAKHKWVVSRSLKEVGPNATLVAGDLGAFVTALTAEHEGDIEVAGPELAASLGDLGLIDEYLLYVQPVVLGSGTPFFARRRSPLRLTASERIGADTLRLTYVPA